LKKGDHFFLPKNCCNCMIYLVKTKLSPFVFVLLCVPFFESEIKWPSVFRLISALPHFVSVTDIIIRYYVVFWSLFIPSKSDEDIKHFPVLFRFINWPNSLFSFSSLDFNVNSF